MDPSDVANNDRSVGRRHYSEGFGPTVSPTKILRPKSNSLEILFRARDEEKELVLRICDPYEGTEDLGPNPYTLQNMKNAFQKPLELALDDEMHSSFVIGWAADNGKPVLINRKFLGIADEDTVPMTDSIFPVLVMGIHEMPALDYCIRRDFDGYEPGFYLILRNRKTKRSLTVTIEVDDGSSATRKSRVQTHRAVLELYTFHILQNKNKLYNDIGNIHRILDIHNSSYGVYGMYGGGPIPPREQKSAGRMRITWDQPRNLEEFGLTSMDSNFRWDINYQKSAQRTGFYCSRDALLVVNERRQHTKDDPYDEKEFYVSLLKEYTFVIIDGGSNYGLFHNEGNTRYLSFRKQYQNLEPLIVIVPEGISSLRIIENRGHPLQRNCNYYNENSARPPIVINWKGFQNDFNRNTGPAQILGTGVWGSSQASAQQSP